MKNILIPTDFSENSWSALQYALGYFNDTTCNIYLLHVANLTEYPVERLSFAPNFSGTDFPSKKKLDDILKKAERISKTKKHKFFALLDYGYFIDAIRRQVLEKRIDLILMATKGASGIKKLIIGSNTGDVITKVHCNVLVIPKNVGYRKPKEIAFATDYNIFYSNPILEAVSEVVHTNNASLKVMHVLKGSEKLSEDQKGNKEYLRDYLEETFPDHNSFHTTRDKKINVGIQSFITDRHIDMMVMVGKNLNFLQQILFDSTVEQVGFHTTVPLLVIHE